MRTKEWPTEPGQYWFYGWLSKLSINNRKPQFYVIKVIDGLSYICEGSFVYQNEGSKGLWTPMTYPLVPTKEFEELLNE